MRSPCLKCGRLEEDKKECSDHCRPLRVYQKFLYWTHADQLKAINPELDTFDISTLSLKGFQIEGPEPDIGETL